MDIRYHAYAVPPPLVDQASTSLTEFVPDIANAPALDLDKTWRELQAIFGPPDQPSPAYELVRGDVIRTPSGWIPFRRFLPPPQVKAIAADLADVDECFVMDGLARSRVRRGGSFDRDVDDALRCIARARDFTTVLGGSASGLLYEIG